jgi:hypothetical protein
MPAGGLPPPRHHQHPGRSAAAGRPHPHLHRVYECPGCRQRLTGQRRCPDCNLFTRRIGDGGCCTGCGEILTITELLNIE